jgi:hypothetical protein
LTPFFPLGMAEDQTGNKLKSKETRHAEI